MSSYAFVIKKQEDLPNCVGVTRRRHPYIYPSRSIKVTIRYKEVYLLKASWVGNSPTPVPEEVCFLGNRT